MADRAHRWQRYWDWKSAPTTREMDFLDRRLFADSRRWACSQASGDVLEVAIGTGLNLPHYPEDLGRAVTLRQGSTHALVACGSNNVTGSSSGWSNGLLHANQNQGTSCPHRLPPSRA